METHLCLHSSMKATQTWTALTEHFTHHKHNHHHLFIQYHLLPISAERKTFTGNSKPSRYLPRPISGDLWLACDLQLTKVTRLKAATEEMEMISFKYSPLKLLCLNLISYLEVCVPFSMPSIFTSFSDFLTGFVRPITYSVQEHPHRSFVLPS